MPIKYFFAPLEGLTYPEYRIAHSKLFPGVDKYFAPFLATGGEGVYRESFLKKHLPDNEYGVKLVPQILSNNSEKFLEVGKVLESIGYDEINLNAGCPAGTVFSKHKGSGMLQDLSTFDSFLDGVFSHTSQKISIKLRMGVESTKEYEEIQKIINRYPFSEVIIHARSRKGLYSSDVDIDGFSKAFESSLIKPCYNGDIFSKKDYDMLLNKVPDIEKIMIGRGALANPDLISILAGNVSMTIKSFSDFHDTLENMYLQRGLTPNYVVERMKNLWQYWEVLFPESEKLIKKIKKCKKMDEYRILSGELIKNGCFNPLGTFISK